MSYLWLARLELGRIMVQRGREWWRVMRESESRLTWRLPKIKSDANTNVVKEI